ncbi:unnamed protein product [Haemonchus placei]|uniref:3-oxoacyl-ACP synthase n=1 Tax=Haemonchus placei TaxID=6290 RepID=A0A0N4WAP5_HAEPC|nr:unnamed protein product [Haemonchus placei]
MYSSDLYTQGDITSILPPYEIEPNDIVSLYLNVSVFHRSTTFALEILKYEITHQGDTKVMNFLANVLKWFFRKSPTLGPFSLKTYH